jgi:hypothetical protein
MASQLQAQQNLGHKLIAYKQEAIIPTSIFNQLQVPIKGLNSL